MNYIILVYIVLIVLDVLFFIQSFNKPGNTVSSFYHLHIVSLLVIKIVSILYFLIITRSVELIYTNIMFLFILVQPYIWLMLCLDYVRTREIVKQIITIIASIIAMAILYNYMMENMYFSNIDTVEDIQQKNMILMLVAAILYTGIGATCLFLFLNTLLRTSKMQQKRFSILILLFFLPWLTSFLGITMNVNSRIGTDFMIVFISCTTYFFKIFNDRIHMATPIATETVFRRSTDAILLVDSGGIIIDANDECLKIYPELRTSLNRLLKKISFSDFLSSHLEFLGFFDPRKVIRYELLAHETKKYYSAQIEPIISEDGKQVGKLLVITDITVYAENEKLLETKVETNEISFLQAQIKPHFLNNTLNTIAALISRDPEKAQELIADLGEFLRSSYYFDNSSSLILLREELVILSTYVSIEQFRYLDRLNFSILCDEIPEIFIPRLMIQPLVENAIAHGIFHKLRGGNVVLKITVLEERIWFQVIDDGIGMTDEKIREILSGHDEKQGIGILNIHNRLMKYYGEGLKIKSIPGTGTTVTFEIPYFRNLREVNDVADTINYC